MKNLTLSILLVSVTFTSSFASEVKECRLFVKGYSTLIGSSTDLEKSVEAILAKKHIELIQESDLREGDYTNDIAKRFEDHGGLPIHRYLMTEKKKLVFVPCFGFPLCSPVIVDSEVESFDGIKYEDTLRFKRVSPSGETSILQKDFKHTYRGELLLQSESSKYFGSPEHIDLVHAIAKKIPSCKTLGKH